MKVLVSACLLGCNCKYNGGNNLSPKVLGFLQGKDVMEICPEVLGGLPTPRIPIELVQGVALALEKIAGEEIECAILQSRSPSCGVNQVYDGTFSATLIKGQGFFAKALKEKGYHVIDAEDVYV